MIWQDHVFNYGPKLATRVTKFREKKLAKLCHPRSRFWEPKLKTWSRQIMFYVIYPELWKLLIKNENFVIVEQGGGGPFDVSGGPFVVLEILEKYSRFWNFFPKFWLFLKILKIMSYDFQSRKQILTLRGVYGMKMVSENFRKRF